jgi:hypothetical protein
MMVHLVAVKSIVSATPNFAICTLMLPVSFWNDVEGSAIKLLWDGNYMEKREMPQTIKESP